MSRLLDKLNRVWIRAKVRLGIPVTLKTRDRQVLEGKILPHYAAMIDVNLVLFAGTAWYTAHYPKLMPQQEFWTIDSVSERRRYGSANHVVDVLGNIAEHVPADKFDLVIVNGVIGYGLDSPAEIERTFLNLLKVLRPGGHLLLGWDDVPERRPVRPEAISALGLYERSSLEPAGAFRMPLDDQNRKTYDFYRKPG